MTDDERLELFSEKSFRLILRIPEVDTDAVTNAVHEAAEVDEHDDVDVSEFSAHATHSEFEGEFRGNAIEGGVSRDVNGNTVLTLRRIVYVDNSADFIDEINDLLRIERLEDAAERLREYDADEVPLKKVL
ncbi:hypothetical protein ACEU6E_01610 [Halorutilales archaeon Cl-col2-1]